MSFEEKAKKLSQNFPSPKETEFLPSGSIVLDSVLGGGIPSGTYIEIASESGLGKSTIALEASRVACSLGRGVVYLDYEQAVNKSQLDGIGVSQYLDERFFWYQPVTFGDGEEIIEKLSDEDELAYIIIDSATSMLPEELRDNSVEEIKPGLQARLASKFLLKYKHLARRRGINFIFINQMRTQINFRGPSKLKSTGGNAQKFYSDIRVRLDKEEQLEKKEETMDGEKKVPYGANVGVWTIKNRYERPFIRAIMTVIYGKGVSNINAYFRWLKKRNLVYHKGAGYYIIKLGDEEEQVRGKVKVVEYIRENKEEIKEFIQDSGGFLLVAEEGE